MVTTLTDEDWTKLIYWIQKGKCTPFLGAGSSYPTLPLGRELAAELVEQDERDFKELCPLTDRQDLAKVCQYLAVKRGNTWPKQKIADIIDKRSLSARLADPLEPHRVLARLPMPLYLT